MFRSFLFARLSVTFIPCSLGSFLLSSSIGFVYVKSFFFTFRYHSGTPKNICFIKVMIRMSAIVYVCSLALNDWFIDYIVFQFTFEYSRLNHR